MTAWTFVLGVVVTVLVVAIAAGIGAIVTLAKRVAKLDHDLSAACGVVTNLQAAHVALKATADHLKLAWKQRHGAIGLGD